MNKEKKRETKGADSFLMATDVIMRSLQTVEIISTISSVPCFPG